MNNVVEYLRTAVVNNASDVFIVAGKELSIKRGKAIEIIGEAKLMPEETEKLVKELFELANRDMKKFKSNGDDDFSLSINGLSRFRISAYKQRGSYSAVIRVVKFGIPNYKEMNIPESIIKLSKLTTGMIIVTGPAGSGKSTTLACLVNEINKTRNAHIITIEDPVEYLYRNNKGIISQRELNIDTTTYGDALRASLRQAPDVILLGEMRDLDTIHTAITAAETGHLVISTLHTVGASNTIDRIIDIFPPNQQQQIRIQLAQTLRTVVSQQLILGNDNNLIPAFEIMKVNTAIKNLIRDNKIYQIQNIIQSSSSEGMVTMDDYLYRLYIDGKIELETALDFALNPDSIQKRV